MRNWLSIPSRMVHMRKTAICFCAFLFFFLLTVCLTTITAAEELRSLPEQPPQIDIEDEGALVQDRYGVPRKQVVLEIFTRPT